MTIPLGVSLLTSSRLAYAAGGGGDLDPVEVTPASRAAGRRAVIAAYEAGYTLFDNADIYCAARRSGCWRRAQGSRRHAGPRGDCDQKGRSRRGRSAARRAGRYDFSASTSSTPASSPLRRLGVEMIDLYLLHRPDFLADPAEVAEAFRN